MKIPCEVQNQYELDDRNRILKTQYMEVERQFSELMKVKEQAYEIK
jgi:hypothetical protein